MASLPFRIPSPHHTVECRRQPPAARRTDVTYRRSCVTRAPLSVLLILLLAEPLSALTVNDPMHLLNEPEKRDIIHLFATLTPAFVNGDSDALNARLSNTIPARRRREILDAVKNEFRQIDYEFFTFDTLTVTAKLPNDHFEIRAEISYAYRGRGSKSSYADSEISKFFEIERQQGTDTFLLVDSPSLFDTVGLAPSRHALAVRFYIIIGILLSIAFWLWMIADCFHTHPPTIIWRTIVIGLPFIGAVAYACFRIVRRKSGKPQSQT